jgi:hypothetical protein
VVFSGSEDTATLLIAILLQAQPPAPFNLEGFKITERPCPAPGTAGADIVVCGRRSGQTDRLGPEAAAQAGPIDQPILPKAETKIIGDVRGSLRGEREGVGGFISNRALVTVTVPF